MVRCFYYGTQVHNILHVYYDIAQTFSVELLIEISENGIPSLCCYSIFIARVYIQRVAY